ncbi:GTPase, G3E family [Tenacibaculum sp. MAR_2009_124]|uniref:GTP-binding protein n=1 Tax=Tenacibaculum sp. MAR_2009_124 TaxID=1250059 RepID=UPI00089CECCB|nr:GTP-binding protein [Tenacibaculum sp. MAR_2009_124]SED06319.1 GTPase, G3E family [Tenacibaculum sp. MAR_2009_124]
MTEKLSNKEAIIVMVGFLGAGKTTLLKHLVNNYINEGWSPYLILNDYENAYLDTQQFKEIIDSTKIKALSGSCICCSGIHVLRDFVNNIPSRKKGITLIEANGTTDACALSEFLGVGIDNRFLPPVQISVVDVKNWQKRGENNELERNQIQVSSLIVLTHTERASIERQESVIKEVKKINQHAKIVNINELDITKLPELLPTNSIPEKMDHHKAHWASCSIDLPELPNIDCIQSICKEIPDSILRVKGCTQIDGESTYTYFERTPSGEAYIRPFNGIPPMGPKLLTVGLGSEVSLLNDIVSKNIEKHKYKSKSL